MNKKILLIIAGVLIVGAIGVIVYKNIAKKDKPASDQAQEVSSPTASQFQSACDVFTLEIAKKHLGGGARPGDTTASDDSTEGDHVITSSCLYDAGEDSLDSRNIQLITAKTTTGEEWNKNNYEQAPFETAEFSEEQPPTLTQIDELGDKAYWNPQMGQLNILIKNGKYWLTIQGSINDTQAEIDHHKERASEIIANLE